MKREEKRENLDLILIESFKKLMTEYPFEKIKYACYLHHISHR